MIKNIIILLLLLLLILLILSSKHKKIRYEKFRYETFSISNRINYPVKLDVFKVYNDSDYFKKFNSYDIKLRNLSPKLLHNQYINNIINPSSNDKKIVYKIIIDIDKDLKHKNNKTILNDKWNISLFKNLEHNYPHTHKHIIFIPSNNLTYNIYNKITFLHEKIHVSQRKYPNVFKELYEKYWFFKHIPKFKIKNKLFTRVNPDTEDLNWVFTYKKCNIIFLAKYNSNAKNISDVTYIGYNIDTHKYKKLENIPEYIEFFGNNSNHYYHPYEISADMISNHCYNNVDDNTKAYKNFKKWWKNLN